MSLSNQILRKVLKLRFSLRVWLWFCFTVSVFWGIVLILGKNKSVSWEDFASGKDFGPFTEVVLTAGMNKRLEINDEEWLSDLYVALRLSKLVPWTDPDSESVRFTMTVRLAQGSKASGLCGITSDGHLVLYCYEIGEYCPIRLVDLRHRPRTLDKILAEFMRNPPDEPELKADESAHGR